MDFQSAEQQFKLLEQQFVKRQISIEQYRATLIQLRVTDTNGNIWQIQERTGAWYVFWQGQWMASTPAKNPTSLEPEIKPAVTPPIKEPGTRRIPWLPVGIAAGGVVVVAVLVLVLGPALNAPKGTTMPQGTSDGTALPQDTVTMTPDVEISFSQAATVSVKDDGNPVKDNYGVSLKVPTGSLEGSGGPAQMTTFNTNPVLEHALDEGYKLETAFYQVSVQGQNDGA